MILLNTETGPLTLQETFRTLVTPFLEFIPKFIGAIVVILIGIFVARVITRIIQKVLSNAGIDKLKDKLEEVEFIEKANIQVLPSVVISKIFYYTLLLFVALVATTVLNVQQVTVLIQNAIEYIPHLLLGFAIIIIGILVAQQLKDISHNACKAVGIPAAGIVSSFVFFFVLITALMIGFTSASLPVDFLTNNLTLILGGIVVAFGVGYGLASKDMMANYLASFYSKNRFKIGDYITIDNMSGEIMEIDSTAVTLFSEGKRIIIPLSKFTQENVTIHDGVLQE